MTNKIIFLLAVFALLTGCATQPDFSEPLVATEESMLFLEPGLRPEVLLFPEYLLMEDFELNQHGIIPESTIVGGGLKTTMGLQVVRRRFNDVLADNNWMVDKVEIGKNSFRIMASLEGEALEIRAVQSLGPTQVFLLYQPLPVLEPSIYD
ncbi:MAG: hypothetical protein V3V05_06900 [Pontiella sp.]